METATRDSDLLNSIADSCLLSAKDFTELKQRLNGNLSPSDILSGLVSAGLLTPYQVAQLQAGRGKGLAFGQYRILEELGRGGFGRVYKAKHTLMDRVVALKVISPEMVGDERARAWFLREVRAITQLDHPNIVRAYDAAEIDGQLFLAMEFVEGPNLELLVKQTGPLPLYLAWELLLQSAQALHYAQEQSMVHRDIKPANLLINRASLNARATRNSKPLVKIVDFGLARLQKQGTGNTLFAGTNATFAGTPDYMSPEQSRNLHDVDIRSDLYSLGCTFYYALTGRKPFYGKSPVDLIVQHWEKTALSIHKLRPEVPPGFVRIVERLMEKKPENRFASPADLIAEMNFLTGNGELVPFTPVPIIDLGSIQEALTDEERADEEPDADVPSGTKEGLTLITKETDQELSQLDHTVAVSPLPDQFFELALPRPAAEPPKQQTKPEPETKLVTPVVEEPPVPPESPETREQNLEAAGKLNPLWRRWHTVLERLLQGKGCGITPQEYKRTHAGLVKSLQANAALNPADKGELYQRLSTFVEPWLSLRILELQDTTTLHSLAAQCEELVQPLGLQAPSRALVKVVIFFGVVCSLFALGLYVLKTPGILRTLQNNGLSAAQEFVTANPVLSMLLALPIVIGVALYGFTRFLRT